MAKHYYGNGKPVNVFRNQAKLAGYHTETKSGDSVSFDDTYNDVAEVELTGNTVQASDYYAKDGLSSQAGIPTPDAPIPVTSNLPSGTYKYTAPDGIYEFTLAEELRGIGSAVDTISFDRVSHVGFVDRNIQKKVFTTIPEWNYMSYNYPLYYITPQALLMKTNKPFICTHYKTFVGSNNGDHTTTWKAGMGTSFWVRDDSFTSAAEMNAFCSAQYNAGTPLTYYYQLATPTRTPLTFTKVSSSSAPECPMTFLTNTPSLDYPAQVYDVNGNLLSNGEIISALPMLRKVGTVADSFVPETGVKTKKIEKIASYAGQAITTPYTSSTGSLTTGATVLYQLATPEEESYTPTPVPTHLGQTIIETDSVVKPPITATAKVQD